MAKKIKKYQKGGPGGISNADLEKVLENLKKKPRTGADMDPGFKIPSDGKNIDPGFKLDIKMGPNDVRPIRLRGKDEEEYNRMFPPPPLPKNILEPKKKGGVITALDQVHKMYSKKKK